MLYPCFLLFSPISLASALLPSVSAKESRHGIWDCTLSEDYFNIQPLAPLVRFSDCRDALSQLLADAADFGKQKYEWSSWGMPFHPRQGGPREGRGTPKKYVAGTCTLAIAFLRDLPPWPGKPSPPFPVRHDMSYVALYTLAEALHEECLVQQRRFGWLAPRVRNSFPLGIFYWATGSAEDEKLPGTD